MQLKYKYYDKLRVRIVILRNTVGPMIINNASICLQVQGSIS